MKHLLPLLLVSLLGFGLRPLMGQEVDGTDINRQLIEREERIGKLSVEDQLKLRAAQTKAAEDPLVKAAIEKRNQALKEFRATLRAAMLKADPSIAPILEQVAIRD